MKNSEMCNYAQNQNGRPSRYVKTGGKTEKDRDPENRKKHPQKREERRRRRIKHSVVLFEPEKCLEKPENGLQPDNGVLQEPRRLDDDDIKQADCG